MIETNLPDDGYFKEIMSKSRLDLPFSDFEDNVMFQIENEVLHPKTSNKDLKLSWFFFIAGSVFGIIFTFFLQQLHQPIFGIQPANLSVFFQILFASILFTQIDTLLKFSKRIKSHDQE